MLQNSISAFEYVTILISIILGLGITQVLSAVADAFYHASKIRFYLPHLLWVIILLFLHIQDWFVLYELKNYPVWKLPTFLFISLYPITLFIIAKLLFPPITGEHAVDLKEFYLNNFPKIFFLFCICILLSIGYNLYFLHAPVFQQSLLLLPLAIFAILAIRKIQTEWLHYALAIFIALLIVFTTVAELNVWNVK
jgi:hypothetical protein